MPKTEKFALLFYVNQEGEENQYRYKVDASDEADAITKAPAELAAVSRQLGKMAHNPILVKVLAESSELQ